MSRPSFHQMETLADFLVQNPGIAKGLLRTAHAKQDTKKKWTKISVHLNSLGGAQKDGKGWAKYWVDKKCTLKKHCALHARSMRRTGGGPAEEIPLLSPIDQQLVAVMGGLQFAIGDSHVAVNPFPTSATITPSPTSATITPPTAVQSDNFIKPEPPNENIVILSESVMESPKAQDIIPIEEPDTAVHVSHNKRVRTILPASQQGQSTEGSSNIITRSRGRSNLQTDKQKFAEIEKKRVEAEMATAKALQEAVDHISSVASAINNLAEAIRESSHIIAGAIREQKQ